jgi:hypothetical protein
MKNFKNILTLMIVVATIFASCKPSGDEPTPTGQAPVFTIPTGGFQFRVLGDTTIDLSQYVSDPQNDGWNLVTGSLSADNGSASFNPTTNELTYNAPSNTSLTSDVIRFTLSDTNGNTKSYSVNISLTISTDPDYGRYYTKFTYDGVNYVSGYAVGVGGQTADLNDDINVNLRFNLYSIVPSNADKTAVKYGSPTFDLANPSFTVQSLVGQSLNIVTETSSFDNGNSQSDYTIGVSLKINGNTYYSVANTDGTYFVEYTEIVSETSGGQVASFLKGNFRILLDNGKTVTGTFKQGLNI